MVKHIRTIRQMLLRSCLSVFDHFVGLVLKELTLMVKKEISLVRLQIFGYEISKMAFAQRNLEKKRI